jgi:hypothetical protein
MQGSGYVAGVASGALGRGVGSEGLAGGWCGGRASRVYACGHRLSHPRAGGRGGGSRDQCGATRQRHFLQFPYGNRCFAKTGSGQTQRKLTEKHSCRCCHLQVLRLDMLSTSVPPSHAILLRYNHSSNALAFERVLDFPGGHSKFAIRYDSASGLYVSLVNNVTSTPDQWLISETARLARTPLALSVSADLVTWTTIAPILWDDTGA